jgi:manganese/zinc/iron transport system permease protein
VIGLPAVGVLMIAALLIIPAATARFWTERLGRMLLLSALFGVLAAVVGTAISASFARLPTGPTIILIAVALFLLSGLFAPRRGLLARKILPPAAAG